MAHSPLPDFLRDSPVNARFLREDAAAGGNGASRPTAPVTTGVSTRKTEQRLPPEKITAFENLNKTLDAPFKGTGIDAIVKKFLDLLKPGQKNRERTFADEARKAGTGSDASFAVGQAELQSGFQREEAGAISKVLLDFFNVISQRRVGALQGIPALTSSETRQERFGFPDRITGGGRGGGGVSGGGIFGGGGGGGSIEGANALAQQRFQDTLGLLNPNPTAPTPSGSPSAPSSGGDGSQAFDRFANFNSAAGFGPGAGAVPGISGSGTPEDPFTNFA